MVIAAPAREVERASSTHWRYREDIAPRFDPVVFDERALAARGLLAGAAGAGRGNTHFLVLDGHSLVLRHYRRGGLARRFSERHYLWSGLERTRAVREFELLRELEAEGLPVPAPYACAVTRRGALWHGSLVTRRLPGRTLAEAVRGTGDVETGGGPATPSEDAGASLPPETWAAVGRTVARFHAAGVRHADLNAHNLLVENGAPPGREPRVHLLDFDRATRRVAPSGRIVRWQRDNLARLARSLAKLARTDGRAFDASGFAALERAWAESLRGSGADVAFSDRRRRPPRS